MVENQTHLVFSRLIEKIINPRIKIVLGLVKVDKRCPPPVWHNDGSLLGCLGEQGNKEAAQKRTAVLLQKILGRVDKNQAAGVEACEEVQPVLLVRKHPGEDGIGQHAPEPG